MNIRLGGFIFSFGWVEDGALSNRVLEEARLQRFLLEVEDLIAFFIFLRGRIWCHNYEIIVLLSNDALFRDLAIHTVLKSSK